MTAAEDTIFCLCSLILIQFPQFSLVLPFKAAADMTGLTPHFLLSQQGGVLQQAKKARQAVCHNATQGAVLPQRQQTPVSVPQQSLHSLGNMKGHKAQLLEQLTVSGLQRECCGEKQSPH